MEEPLTQQTLDFERPLMGRDPQFNGSDYDHQADSRRLTGQLLRVFSVMRDRTWRSLDEIASATGDPPASVSAQLRHLRKPRFGGYTVEKRNRGNGLFEYRVL